MITLEQMGYKLEGQAYVKHIDSYKITLFPSGKDFIRRIIKDNRVTDMRKVNMTNLEKDKPFSEMLQRRSLALKREPEVVRIGEVKHLEEVKHGPRVLDTEVHLNKEVE